MAEFRVVIPTNRFDESCRFYGDVLGWPVDRAWAEPDRGVLYSAGFGAETRIELLEDPTATPPSGVFCSVEVTDATATAARLDAAGAEVSQPLAVQPWGHRSVGVRDPNGLQIVLFEVLP